MKTSILQIIQILSILLIASSINSLSSQCHVDDFAALRQLYLDTDGDDWSDNTNWTLVKDNTSPPTGCDLSTMYGISLDASNERVEWIDLDVNDLAGEIPADLGDMIGLKKLHLQYNAISGYIPEELSNLTEILELYLNRNELIGGIPTAFGTFPKITNLNLSFNQLSGSLPASLGDLSTLISYRVNDNLLSGCYDSNLLNIWLAGSNSKTSLNNYFTADWASFGATGDGQCCNTGDFQALRDFYFATGGDNWTDNTGWSLVRDNNCPPGSYDLGTMFGVTTDINGRVTKILLNQNKLTGSLTQSIGLLNELIEFKFGNSSLISSDRNIITGILPIELGALINLTKLHAHYNELEGSIPKELGNLISLQELYLNGNNLKSVIPNEFENLQNLTDLLLAQNQLLGDIPPELGNLIGLERLSLHTNNLSGAIPSELGNLIGLETLHLNSNDLTGSIPSELGNLSNLTELWLYLNDFSGCYDLQLSLLCDQGFINTDISVGNNFDTDWEDFCNNQNGVCPPCTADEFSILRKFYFATDGDNWADNTGWELVRNTPCPPASYNPATMHGVTTDASGSVTEIDLEANNLVGILIPELGYLSNLSTLDLSSNQLTNIIPSELGNLSNLSTLDLSSNQLTNIIPSELGNLSNLEKLALSFNNFSGSIPSELGNLLSLVSLILNGNELDGVIPSELGNLTSLKSLSLYANDLTGNIPPELGNLSDLTLLLLYSNHLTGNIPSEIGNLSNLSDLILRSNNLSGCYHPHLSNLCSAGFTNSNISNGNSLNAKWEDFCNDPNNTPGNCLDCAGSGNINPQNAALEALFLQTAGNSWTNKTGWVSNCDPCGYLGGSPWYGVLCDAQKLNVTSLILNNNNLDGSIPAEIGDLTELTGLKLSINPDLEGNLPTAIGDLTNLISLNLGGCDLDGSIPTTIGNLIKLETLNLNSNGFSGSIPASIENLDSLTILRIASNALTGGLPESIGSLSKLEEINVSNNNMFGTIPRSFGFLDNLEMLNVSGNQVMSATCYYPSLLRLCDNNVTVLVSNTALPNWTNFCNNQSPLCSDCATTDVHWSGAINLSWSNAGNWDTGCVPDDTKNVWIETIDNQVNVNNGILAEAKSIHIDDTNLLFIKTNGDLVIGPGTGAIDTSVVNYGKISNRGDVSFRNVTDVNIYNEGVIQNGFPGASSTGDFTIDNTSQSSAIAIINKDSIVNYKTINTMGGHRSIQNEGDFYNYRDIVITGTQSSAIWNKSGYFSNTWNVNIPASMTIHDLNTSSSNGIYNEAVIWNKAELNITNVGANGLELNDPNPYDTEYVNIEGNPVTITGAGSDGINIGAHTVVRLGDLHISDVDGDGIENDGIFQDFPSSQVTTIDNASDHGLNNKGRYLNTGNAMIISDTGGNGIYNESEYSLSSGKNTSILDATIGGIKNLGKVTVVNSTLFISGSPYGIENGDLTNTTTEFINDGQVNIDNCGDFGLLNYAIYNIDVAGNLIITNIADIPFESILGSEFECLGLMDANN